MTTKEREAVQTFFNQMTRIDNEADEAFKELQELNAKFGSGSRWCCAQINRDEILEHCKVEYIKNRAKFVYDNYVKAIGQRDLMSEFGQTVADLGFWK